MGHRLMGRTHAALHHLTADLRRRLPEQTGQGTVEYVALILLVAAVFAVVVSKGGAGGETIAKSITDKIEGAIQGAGGK